MSQSADRSGTPIPGPKGSLLRNVRGRTSDFAGFLTRLNKRYGDIVSYRLPFKKCCVLFDPDLIRDMLVEQEPFFAPFQPGAGDNAFFKHGFLSFHHAEEHRRRRPLFDTAFTENRLRAYASIIIEESRALRERCVTDTVVDIKKEMERFVWDSLVRTIIGHDVRIDRKIGLDMLAAGKMATLLDVLPFNDTTKKYSPLQRRGQRAAAIVDEAIYAAIERARDPSTDGGSLIAHFVRAADQGLVDWTYETDRALRDEAIATLALFTDSPTAALVFGAYHIARNRPVRDRLEREVDEVLGERPLDTADFSQLSYTLAVFKETLRLDPPAYAGLAKEALEDRVIGGYLIPKGTLVHPGIGVLHRNRDYWDDPNEFRPERWLDVRDRPGCPAHAYVPFGSGPHACPGRDFAGMLFVLGLTTLIQRLRLDPVSARPPRKENIGVGIRGAFRARVSRRRSA